MDARRTGSVVADQPESIFGIGHQGYIRALQQLNSTGCQAGYVSHDCGSALPAGTIESRRFTTGESHCNCG